MSAFLIGVDAMGKFIDLTGQKFNRLTVLYRVENSIENKAQWACLCDCGNRIITTGKSLRSGNTKSCGCWNIDQLHNRCKDITGQRFGNLVVIGKHGHDTSGKILWECMCDCGNITYVTASNLKTKYSKTVSCGCYRKKNSSDIHSNDLSNMIFGELTALESVGSSRSRKRIWRCICSCGKECYVNSGGLISGNTRSCGCIKSHCEKKISEYLKDHNIMFVQQKTFIGCIDQSRLRFDFYLPDYNMAIEYDGEFHFRDFPELGTDLASQQQRDHIKTLYCEENDIVLLRIPYWEKDNLESILTDWLF